MIFLACVDAVGVGLDADTGDNGGGGGGGGGGDDDDDNGRVGGTALGANADDVRRPT